MLPPDPSDHFIRIYQTRAADYQALIAAEDAAGELARALRQLAPWDGRRVLDLGAGTGRLALLMAASARQLLALDLHADMLREQAVQRARVGGRWDLARADMRQLPCASGWADLVIAGWSIGHLTGWFAAEWPGQVGRVLAEMRRAAAPGGRLAILETLTTGSLTPAPPSPGLADYYAWLENEHGFTRHVVRTDYQFASVEEAVARAEFFFGPELSEKIRAQGWARLPEWTGLWISQPTS